MGVDLRLLPFDCDKGDFAFSHTIIQFNRNYELWDAVENLPQLPVPKSFTSFSGRNEGWDDISYGETNEDPYGKPIQYTTAGELSSITGEGLRTKWDAPTWAYLDALPPETKVALYWH